MVVLTGDSGLVGVLQTADGCRDVEESDCGRISDC